MHVLTKIFVVLVSLLAVMLVPLVVVYTANEDSYQQRFAAAEDKANAAAAAFSQLEETSGILAAQKDGRIEELTNQIVSLQGDLGDNQVKIRRLENELAETEGVNDQIMARLSTLANSVDAGQKLNGSLVDDLRALRRDALASERQKVELDEALRDTMAKLDVAEEARRFLQEELQRMKEDQAHALDKLQRYAAQYGDLNAQPTALTGSLPDRTLIAGVTNVRYDSNRTLVEIDAGSRDGVKMDWQMTVGEGGSFVARLRIIEVDINRSVGVVDLERGSIQIGQRVYAVAPN